MSRFLNLTEKEHNKPIYLIVGIDRLFELFENRCNVLTNPSLWKDPYENFILKSKVRRLSGEIVQFTFHENIYGQCWSRHRASDAMWRLYSDGGGVRIKTTVDRLLSSIYHGGIYKPDMSCGVGKIRYLSQKRLMKVAHSTFSDASISSENMFHSLLVKRLAFSHEREVRLFYIDLKERENGRLFSYPIDPHDLISQIMLDPLMSFDDAEALKIEIRRRTGFRGDIKRSLHLQSAGYHLRCGPSKKKGEVVEQTHGEPQ